jgi:hypothetical protein
MENVADAQSRRQIPAGLLLRTQQSGLIRFRQPMDADG